MYQNASDAYRVSHNKGLDQRGVMAEVLRMLIGNLYAARDSYKGRQFDIMSEQNSRTLHILALLRDSLRDSGAMQDNEAAGSARHLNSIYGELFSRLVNILRASDVPAEYESLVELLKPVYRAWAGSPEPVAESVQ